MLILVSFLHHSFFNAPSTTNIYTLSLHDALPIYIQITLKQMLRDFIGIRVNRAKKSGMVNITSSVNSRERSGINTILHELNPLLTLLVILTMPLILARLDRKSGSAGMPRPISYAV